MANWMTHIAVVVGAGACVATSLAVAARATTTQSVPEAQHPPSAEAPVAPPGVRAKLIGQQGATRTYQLVLAPGTEAMGAISEFVVANHIQAARAARPARPRGQRWSTFLRNHAPEIWACDFLQAYDVFFRSIFAFVFIELATRKVVFAVTTRFPSQTWVTQQLRNATPAGAAPRFLIRDRDDKFGSAFDALARATGIRMVRTAVRAPNMNAVCERFLGSLRRECLDHALVLDGHHFQRVVAEYVRYHNAARPHQGIHQQTPVPAERPAAGNFVALPVLAGLHHEYRRAA
jgi:putative transposase